MANEFYEPLNVEPFDQSSAIEPPKFLGSCSRSLLSRCEERPTSRCLLDRLRCSDKRRLWFFVIFVLLAATPAVIICVIVFGDGSRGNAAGSLGADPSPSLVILNEGAGTMLYVDVDLASSDGGGGDGRGRGDGSGEAVTAAAELRSGLINGKDVAIVEQERLVVWTEMTGGPSGRGGVFRGPLAGAGSTATDAPAAMAATTVIAAGEDATWAKAT